MIDLKLGNDGDLFITSGGDVVTTNSIVQAVKIRLLWFFNEWRLSPEFGLPYFETILVKNPNVSKIRFYIRKAILEVEEVKKVGNIDFSINEKSREAKIKVEFSTNEESFTEEVSIEWRNMD